jgi:uncharacterized protein YaeQ
MNHDPFCFALQRIVLCHRNVGTEVWGSKGHVFEKKIVHRNIKPWALSDEDCVAVCGWVRRRMRLSKSRIMRIVY